MANNSEKRKRLAKLKRLQDLRQQRAQLEQSQPRGLTRDQSTLGIPTDFDPAVLSPEEARKQSATIAGAVDEFSIGLGRELPIAGERISEAEKSDPESFGQGQNLGLAGSFLRFSPGGLLATGFGSTLRRLAPVARRGSLVGKGALGAAEGASVGAIEQALRDRSREDSEGRTLETGLLGGLIGGLGGVGSGIIGKAVRGAERAQIESALPAGQRASTRFDIRRERDAIRRAAGRPELARAEGGPGELLDELGFLETAPRFAARSVERTIPQLERRVTNVVEQAGKITGKKFNRRNFVTRVLRDSNLPETIRTQRESGRPEFAEFVRDEINRIFPTSKSEFTPVQLLEKRRRISEGFSRRAQDAGGVINIPPDQAARSLAENETKAAILVTIKNALEEMAQEANPSLARTLSDSNRRIQVLQDAVRRVENRPDFFARARRGAFSPSSFLLGGSAAAAGAGPFSVPIGLIGAGAGTGLATALPASSVFAGGLRQARRGATGAIGRQGLISGLLQPTVLREDEK